MERGPLWPQVLFIRHSDWPMTVNVCVHDDGCAAWTCVRWHRGLYDFYSIDVKHKAMLWDPMEDYTSISSYLFISSSDIINKKKINK